MTSFSRLKYFRQYIQGIKSYKNFNTKQSPIFEENNLQKITIEQNKILYSSKLITGYHRQRIELSKVKNIEKRNLLKRCNVRPIPVSLKLIENVNIKAGDDEEQSKENELKDEGILKIDRELSTLKYPKNWLHDYEFYDEDDEKHSTNGSPDSSVPPSKVPCNGCGAHLHCADTGLPGYIPSEIFIGRTENELKRIICQRCHFLKEYNIALDVSVTPEMYIDVLNTIKDKFALAILIVDLLDFPCSIWPGIQDLLGNKRPVFVVGNKVDLLPKDSSNYLNHVTDCLTEAVLKAGLSKMNLKHICLISAKTGYGVEELITQLHKKWAYKGDVYLVGCTNVGKSSLFNALLRSDYCKVQAVDLVKKATACIWPGTTLKMLKFPILRPSDFRIYERFKRLFSEHAQKRAEDKLRTEQLKKTNDIQHATLIGHIGQTFKKYEDKIDEFGMSKGINPILTLDERHKDFVKSKWCYDTPGVIHSDQIHHLLTTEELLELIPKEMITPRVFRIKPQTSLFVSGLSRIDFISSTIDAIRITIYSSLTLPILITKLEDADEIYEKLLGSKLLGVPKGDDDRLKKFPKLESSEPIEIIGEANDKATCDITLSSIGWIGLSVPIENSCIFQIWTPEKRGIHIRKPPLIPFGEKLRGKKARGSLAYKLGKPFIKQ